MDLVKSNSSFELAISDVENQKKMCELLMKTPHYAKLGADGIYAVVAKAKSLEMDPIDALNGALYYVKGRVGMSTEAMAARMRQAGHSITKDPKSDHTCCILHGKRADNGDTWVTSFSIEDAKRAGIYLAYDRNGKLIDGSWQKYPSVMCYNRAMSMMFRQLTPDLSKNAGYTLDELKEISSYEPLPPSPRQLEHQIEQIDVVSKEQADELAIILSECETKYQIAVWDTLSKAPIGIDSLERLPLSLFERIKNAAIKNRESYQATLVQSYEDDVQLDEAINE